MHFVRIESATKIKSAIGFKSRPSVAFLSGENSLRLEIFSNPADKARHDKMVSLVEQMLNLHPPEADKDAADAATQERLQRFIDSTDEQIDALVYELYEVSEEEREVVEG